MINLLWSGLMLAAAAAGAVNGTLGEIGEAALSAAGQAVELSFGLLGGYALWCGLMEVMKGAGWMKGLERLMRRPIRFLFPQAANDRAREAIVANLAANMLGVGNAATPAGLSAMREMARCEKRKGFANDAMCMLLVVNASSVQLIPTSIIALRQSAGSADPAGILLPALLATTVSTAAGILAARILARFWP